MRLYLKLTRNKELIPFNYQPFLTGALHKWIGANNDEHEALSLYSFSWLQNVEAKPKGINLTRDSYFFVSAYDESLIKQIVKGILDDPSVCFGASIYDIQIAENRAFGNEERFTVASPVFIKRRLNNKEKHFTYDSSESNKFLTETIKKKLSASSLPTEGISIRFDESYSNPQIKIIHYNNVGNRVNICPVIVKGTPEQIAFAWNVGIGNSTGIGFGALK
ncbi:CRISPR-associated endoribonuclease Cas6 [Ilyomonas limi]|uniref:CRISPR-associated endoribonuclease Cas6 n=1 Tax=Ilyomonas limi TaxID=2575867 RepID=A0A4V5UTV5_9BACT|nr:CRISPR-associated endoribonuclease Cas6 [Ilyomonas limi]TKK66633.1 CRISPR-associated endoribonuclease Cas6 [Ilyomonas limi]